MFTYTLINIVFLLIVFAVYLYSRKRINKKALLITFIIMFILTAIFDSLIIALSIVDYDSSKILGINILNAPIEDFAYTIAAVILVPSLWTYLDGKR